MPPGERREPNTDADSGHWSDHGERAGGFDWRCKSFENGRQLAAWLGLVRRQHSSGGKSLLLGISKRGDTNLRTLQINGARTVIRVDDRKADHSDSWLVLPPKYFWGRLEWNDYRGDSLHKSHQRVFAIAIEIYRGLATSDACRV